MGSFQGSLANLSTPELGTVVIQAVIDRAGISPEQLDEVIMGGVLPAGLKQDSARPAMPQALCQIKSELIHIKLVAAFPPILTYDEWEAIAVPHQQQLVDDTRHN